MQMLPEALIERLKTRQTVLVTGLGCAELAGLPGWPGLCERLADKLGDGETKQAILDLAKARHLLPALAMLRELVPTETLVQVLRDAYPTTAQVPESLIALAKAPWRGLVSTGFDPLWASALATETDLANRIVFASGAAGLEQGRGRFLLQIFGRADVPESLCLSPADVTSKVIASGANDFLLGLHKKLSFVFVGFAPSDPDLDLLASRLLGASPSTLSHFFVAPGLSNIDSCRVKAELGLVPVSVEGALDDVFKVLAHACDQAGDKPAPDDVEAWLERLTADPRDEEAFDMVEQGLAKLGENKEWERLVGLLINRVELASDPKEQSEDLHEAGMILHKELSASDRAYPVLMTALRLSPHNAELLADAKRVAEAANLGKEFLDEIHEIEKDAVQAPDGGPMALGVAKVLAEDPARQEEAIAAYQKALTRDPANGEAMEGLETLLRKAERWNDLAELLQKAAERNPSDEKMSAKLEDIYQRTQQTAQLIELFQARLVRDPDDAETSAKLETIYEQGQRWQPLAALYERRLAKNPDHAEALAKLEKIYKQTQQWQPLGALYERALAKNPDHAEALAKVEDLYRASEQWRPLADLLERRAQKAEPAQARTLRLERASVLIDKLKDSDAALAVARAFLPDDASAAEEIFAKCLAREPNNPAALVALADLARNKGDHLRAAKFLLDAAERTQSPLELGRIFAEAGVISQDQIGDEAKATELFERALAADPEQTTAAQRLLALREKAENWAGAEPLLDLMIRKTDDANTAAKADLHKRLARAARLQGKIDKAIAALAAATKLDPQSSSLALELGDIHFGRRAWSEARAEYERARDLLGDGASAEQRCALWEKLATCSLEFDELDAALRQYEAALALEPEKRSLLETVIELRASRGDDKEVVDLKRRLLALVTRDDERATLLEDMGDRMQEKLGDWTGAMDSYLHALEAEPARRSVLYKTLDYYTQEKQWSLAIATLEKLVGLESEPPARARLRYATAAIHRDELKDTAKAVEEFGRVLDDSPLFPKAFEAIEKLLGEGMEWKELERAYRKQIKRLPQDAPSEMKLRLWDSLADVAIKQKDKESAALTMEVAASFDRDNFARQERLAQMYFDLGPSAADKAIAQHQFLLARKPDRLDSYKALAALYFQAGAHDKMWCVAGAMTCLGKADPPLQALYENFRPTQMPNASGKLNEESWRKIIHPTESPYLGALFALLSPALAMTTAQPHKSIGVERSARVDVAGSQWSYAAALRYVGNTIEMALPDVFIKRDVPGTVSPVNLKEKNARAPALVVGIGFDQLSSQSQVIFDLAKRMVLLRPERFPRFALATPSALEIAVRAGLQLGGSPIGAGEHGAAAVDKMAKQLDGLLSAPLRSELKTLAKKYVEACGNTVDIPGWIVASDLTASRAALVLCGDIVAASRVLTLEPSGQSPMPLADRLRDLLSYFISEDHFAVRAALGMQVNLTPPSTAAGGAKPRMSHTQIKAE